MKNVLFSLVCAVLFVAGLALLVVNIHQPTRPVLIFAGVLLTASVAFAFATDVTAAASKVLGVVGPYLPWASRRPAPPPGD